MFESQTCSGEFRDHWFRKEVPDEIKKWAFGWGVRYGLNCDQIDEAEQNTALVVIGNIVGGTLKEDKFGHWRGHVCLVAEHKVQQTKESGWRQNKRQRPYSDAADCGSEDLNPSVRHEATELCQKLAKALDRLDETKRTLLYDRFFAGVKFRDLALKHGVNPSSLHGRVHRALNELRRAIA